MPEDAPTSETTAAEVIAAVAAAQWPSLSPADRREKARRGLGIEPLAPWGERMVYVSSRGK